MIRGLRAAVVVVAALSLAGCVGEFYSDLDGEAGPEDVLPAVVDVDPEGPLDVESVRFVGEHDGTSFYLGLATTGGHCITMHGPEEEWMTGCGREVRVSGFGVTAKVVPDGAVTPDGWVRVGNNILVES